MRSICSFSGLNLPTVLPQVFKFPFIWGPQSSSVLLPAEAWSWDPDLWGWWWAFAICKLSARGWGAGCGTGRGGNHGAPGEP